MLARTQPAPAVTQPVQRGELVGQLAGQGAAAERADVHGPPSGRLGGDVQHRVGNVEPAAQIDVPIGALEPFVARGAVPLDQPVLEHQSAQLEFVGR